MPGQLPTAQRSCPAHGARAALCITLLRKHFLILKTIKKVTHSLQKHLQRSVKYSNRITLTLNRQNSLLPRLILAMEKLIKNLVEAPDSMRSCQLQTLA